jgi:hypothetical protein
VTFRSDALAERCLDVAQGFAKRIVAGAKSAIGTLPIRGRDPFFDADTHAPRAKPRVLTPEERQALSAGGSQIR